MGVNVAVDYVPAVFRSLDTLHEYPCAKHFKIFRAKTEQDLESCLEGLVPNMELSSARNRLEELERVLRIAVKATGAVKVAEFSDRYLRDEVRYTSLNALLVQYLSKNPEELGDLCEKCISHITPDTVACGAIQGRRIFFEIIPDFLTFDISLGEFYHEWTGSRIWPGAYHLSRLLLTGQLDIKDCNVLELGSGLGICGIAALHAGAHRVAFTEYQDSLLERCRENVQTNCDKSLQERFTYLNLEWSSFNVKTHAAFSHWNSTRDSSKEVVVIGSEVVYEESHVELIMHVLTELFENGFDRGFLCIMSKPTRYGFSRFRSLLESTISPFRCTIEEVTDPLHPDEIAAIIQLYRNK